MITAWSPSGVQRSRSTAVLWRLLGLGLFLFGLLYTHIVTPDATVRHLSVGGNDAVPGGHFEPVADHETVASATSVAADETLEEPSEGHQGHRGGHGGHGQHQAGAADCALGQPSHGPGLAVPSLSPLGAESHDNALPRLAHAGLAEARDCTAPTAHAADSEVLRI